VVIPIKKTSKLDSPFQSDSGESFLKGRVYRSLLRSTGHLFRDGRWAGDPDSFHAFRDVQNPGLGPRLSFLGGSYFKSFLVGVDGEPLVPYAWTPAASLGYSSKDAFDEYVTELPVIVDPLYSDYVLELNALGTSAIQRFRPGNPVASLGQFLVELRELPRLPIFLKSRAKSFRDLGREYLNVEFGWVPFVKDLIGVYRLQQTIQDRLNKLIRDNGIQVKRRSKHVETISDLGVKELSLTQPFGRINDPTIGGDPDEDPLRIHGPVPFGYFDSFIPGTCDIKITRTEKIVSWYVGTFFYYVPDIGSDRWTRRAKDVLFGSSPTPSLIYSVYPWTWLADWFGNVGNILSNLSTNAVDNEVLTDSFIMQHRIKRTDYEVTCNWEYFERIWAGNSSLNFVLSPGSIMCSPSHVEVNKLRRQASPFGFGLHLSDFTARQLAIIAALLTSSARKPALFAYWRGALS